MNCKQGDLAVVVGMPINTAWNDRFVTVVRPLAPGFIPEAGSNFTPTAPDTPTWLCKTTGELPVIFKSGQTELSCFKAIGDRFLRPIRPQSDDAVDTHSLRLPAPQKEQA